MKENNGDLQDSRRDKKYLQQETASIDLPEVKDIPGQEHIQPPVISEMVDTTVSSADEEGAGIFNDNKQEEMVGTDAEADDATVTDIERAMLQDSSESTSGDDDMAQKIAMLDNTDEDGEALNEETNYSGSDLDVPGAELDDDNEEIGEEDEENNSYSMGQ